MKSEKLLENLLAILPYWHYKIDKQLKQSLKSEMSLETYYCLQALNSLGPMTMTELAQNLKIPKQQATKIINNLYQYQFVKRIHDEDDRRFIRIEITRQAIDYIEQNYYRSSEFVQELEEKIGEKEVEALSGAIEVLLRILPKID